LHSYFTVSAIENLSIAGSFAGKEFLNKMVGEGEMQTEDREEITISEEYDRVYKGVNDPVLKDSGSGKTVSLNVFWQSLWLLLILVTILTLHFIFCFCIS
jgi:glucose-6-phosphate 1-epimerase